MAKKEKAAEKEIAPHAAMAIEAEKQAMADTFSAEWAALAKTAGTPEAAYAAQAMAEGGEKAAEVRAAMSVLDDGEAGPESAVADAKDTKKDAKGKKGKKVILTAAQTVRSINAKLGKSMIQPASKQGKLRRIRTGVFELDVYTGGGWPCGRTALVWGPKSTGKSLLMLKAVANAQQMCGNCWQDEEACDCGAFKEVLAAWICVESDFDGAWARAQGVDTDRLLLNYPESAEQAVDIMCALYESSDLDLIICDSIAFLTPQVELGQSAADVTMGLQARIVGNWIRRMTSASNRHKNTGRAPTLLCTNQIRMQLGSYGSPMTQPGGMAPGFAASMEVSTGTLGPKGIDMDTATGLPVSVTLKATMSKQKTAATVRAEMTYMVALQNTPMWRPGQIIEADAVLSYGLRYGVFTVLGERVRGLSPEAMEEMGMTAEEAHWSSEAALVDWLKTERARFLAVREIIFREAMMVMNSGLDG